MVQAKYNLLLFSAANLVKVESFKVTELFAAVPDAFLLFNSAFEVVWAGSYMHMKHPDRLEAAFGSYDRRKRWPGSFWMRKIT